jgi:hypothetical protein
MRWTSPRVQAGKKSLDLQPPTRPVIPLFPATTPDDNYAGSCLAKYKFVAPEIGRKVPVVHMQIAHVGSSRKTRDRDGTASNNQKPTA